jgi:hypothetical protein
MNSEIVAQHTPGPWMLETVRTSSGICHKIGAFPSRGARETTYACVYDDGLSTQLHPTPELLANARLIAAAPDLLEALKCIETSARHSIRCESQIDRGDWLCDCGVSDYIEKADMAIAKAEGRS